jgi:hypothetical protein
MTRSYNLTKTNRKKQSPKLSPERKRLYEETKPEDMTIGEFVSISHRQRANIINFIKYHKFDDEVKERLLEDLFKTKASDLRNYSVSATYKRLYK